MYLQNVDKFRKGHIWQMKWNGRNGLDEGCNEVIYCMCTREEKEIEREKMAKTELSKRPNTQSIRVVSVDIIHLDRWVWTRKKKEMMKKKNKKKGKKEKSPSEKTKQRQKQLLRPRKKN